MNTIQLQRFQISACFSHKARTFCTDEDIRLKSDAHDLEKPKKEGPLGLVERKTTRIGPAGGAQRLFAHEERPRADASFDELSRQFLECQNLLENEKQRARRGKLSLSLKQL
jgi:hypothetical protein